MSLSAILLSSIVGVSFAFSPTLGSAEQCSLVTSTYTGPAVWIATADAIIPPKTKGTAGSWNQVLGQSEQSGSYAWSPVPVSGGNIFGSGGVSPLSGRPLSSWKPTIPAGNNYYQGYSAIPSTRNGLQTTFPTDQYHTQTTSSPSGRPSTWVDWASESTIPAYIGAANNYGNTSPNDIASSSGQTISISPAETNNVSPGEPFVIYLKTGGKISRRDILFVGFKNNIATVSNSQTNATLMVLAANGQLMTYYDRLFAGPPEISGAPPLSLSQAQPTVTSGWFFDSDGLKYHGATFCLDKGSNRDIRIVFGQVVPTDCTSVQLAGDKHCASCRSATPANTATSASAAATTTSTISQYSATSSSVLPLGTSTSTSTSTYSSITSTVSIIVGTSTSTTSLTSVSTTSSASSLVPGNSSTTVTNSTTTSTGSTTSFSNSTTTATSSTATAVPSSGFDTNSTTDANGTTVAITGPIDLGSVPAAQLGAVFPPDIDMGSLDRFVAQVQTNLWFSGENAGGADANGAVTVRVAVNYTYPSIVLDHSAYINDISCTSTSIQGSINNTDGFKQAQAQWITNPLIFITTTPSCLQNGDSAFFLVSSGVTFGSTQNTFVVSGSSAEMGDIFEDMGIDFGNISYDTPGSNSTSSNSTGPSCSSPASSTLQGLPAAVCGSKFDKTLDDALGYYAASGDEQYVLSIAAPGAASINSSSSTRRAVRRGVLDEVAGNVQSRGIHRRGLLKKIGHAISHAATVVVHTVAPAISSAVTHVETAVSSDLSKVVHTVGSVAVAAVRTTIKVAVAVVKNYIKLAVFVATGNYSNSLKLPFHLGPSEALLVDSPWGDAFKIFTWTPDKGLETFKAEKTALDKIASSLIGEPDPEPGVEVFCVNCTVAGQFVITGSISATPLSGLKAASIGLQGNLTAGLFLGINAFAEWEKKYEIDIFTQGLPGWEIPGIVTLGPMLTLGVEADLDITAQGQLLVGGALTWTSMSAYVDFVNLGNSHQSGWRPSIEHQFDVTGTLSAKASLGLPVSLEVGIVVLKKYGRTIALVDDPAIAANLVLSADYNVTTGLSVGTDECGGIEWDIGFENTITLGFKKETSKDGKEIEIDDGPKFTLDEWDAPPLASGCIVLGAGGGSGKDSGDSTTTSTVKGTTSVTSLASTSTLTTTGTTTNLGSTSAKTTTSAKITKVGTTSSASLSTTTGNALANTTVTAVNGTGSSNNTTAVVVSNTTCSYWSGGKQWVDPRNNSWVISCNISASQLTNRRLINQFTSSSMLDCFATCYYDNSQCEQAVYLSQQQTCGWLVTAICDPSSSGCVASGTMLSSCTSGVDCPSIMATTFDALSLPVSPFVIHSASYGNVDITSEASNWWNKGHFIAPRYVNQYYQFSQIGDPIPGKEKTYYLYYSYNGEHRAFASTENSLYDIQAGPIQFPQVQRVSPDPEVYRLEAVSSGYTAASWLRIYDFNFGAAPLPLSSLDAIMQFWYSALSLPGAAVEIDLSDFQNIDTLVNIPKDGAIYFSSFLQTPDVISCVQNMESSFVTKTMFNPPAGVTRRSHENFGLSRLADRSVDSSGGNSTNGTGAAVVSTTAQNTTVSNNSTSDVTLAILTDTTGALTLQLGTDGNLWLSSDDISSDDIANFTTGEYLMGVQQPNEQIIGDSAGNLLHYFPQELSVTGASRLRLASWDQLPLTSQIISLVNMNGTTTSDKAMVAVDTQGNYAWVWVCVFQDQLSRVFVTNSATDSASALTASIAQYTVTGGNATSCNPLLLAPTWDDGSS